jgi:hypothetical protein
MSDPIVQWIIGSTAWAQDALIENTQPLTEPEFCQQPSPNAPPIGWHLWHIARWADILQESMTDQVEYWKQAGLPAKFGLDPTKLGLLQMGTSQSSQEATDVIITMGKEPLLEYARTVFDMAVSALEALTLEDLYTPCESIIRIDWSTTPFTEGKGEDVLLFNNFEFHIGHSQRHLGMIEALIGAMFNREGTATI